MLSPSASAGVSLLLVAVGVLLYLSSHPHTLPRNAAAIDSPKRKAKKSPRKVQDKPKDKPSEPKPMTVRILYGTQTGASKTMAETLEKTLFALNISGFHFQTSVVNMKDYDQDNLEQEDIVVAVLSTWTHGKPPEDALVFCNWITDMTQDFRVSKSWLNGVQHAVFGLGNAEYDEDYGTAAKNLDRELSELGSPSLVQLGLGDDNIDQFKQFDVWMDNLVAAMCEYSSEKAVAALKKSDSPVKAGKKEWLSQNEFRRQKRAKKAEVAAANGETVELNEEDLVNEQFLVDEFSDDEEQNQEKADDDSGMVDVEDIGKSMKESEAASKSREMVTPMQRKALTKEGYKIIGTHSAVKLCRWTKHQLRGRGGCYKHAFYGITSYQCMETTPSLACANKCVFCWRHHKNPVGRVWRWKTDDAETLVKGSIERHQGMIKELKGLPGLIPARWDEAFTVRHCALSLVGEAIMYPQINEFCKQLHNRHISSFLVTNAQFPEKIAALDPITQLYVSVDAATKESLRAVDRPLFKDFWERFLACLEELKHKGQRTVYRLTLVKSYNMEELDNYAELINIGQPDFIEVKAVTYCGKSDGSDLTMKNVPWHEEVRGFCSALCDRVSGEYALASEHAHSNCVLIAKKKFCRDGVWHTWIDYERFHELVTKFYEDGTPFTADDYTAPTPHWAVYDSKEQGFDPVETRFRRTKDGKVVEFAYQSTESGCG
ncbi:S-adenosyl-L-methionine-dependent tRNA 4-demethylwyosine synthase [Phytophthora fragariae]|uniref:tRNA 4-demethylwyosine synthase (AdoMet-dependent) n=1 Tax=Phytophthora fragariae TaxID=53985 RepID=A0A6A4DX20_9STRA|nr:S-adenosyl-L-methionine-dependent tRNA 4-demethylwyosine synthase [Phytophthora fragariae]KAE8939081.1 S-adenosyl-L-methionine-dependent tRNA 4-demethylwyosine synthase [Phytophthora fragariae]KAE9012801.1 S-adenosyl-L-methionine-dependent tRNA 4-demethylwyosine synthase [Phytophthora fragariae]KAE9115237.1 S-adenosyl-L-methionine-dependent tRNA 4-demethylwyosine synthase [Phytophthora fragariae]KAE9115501.1 S-adenosyl-L-methionine-dependent tRNA 4-demethylwyosine synthase [Phytophthora frag